MLCPVCVVLCVCVCARAREREGEGRACVRMCVMSMLGEVSVSGLRGDPQRASGLLRYSPIEAVETNPSILFAANFSSFPPNPPDSSPAPHQTTPETPGKPFQPII